MAPKLTAVLEMDDEFEARVIASAERIQRLGARIEDTGRTLTKALTAPLALLATPAIAAAAALRTATNAIRSGTGTTGGDLQRLVGIYQQVRADTGGSMTEASGAVVTLARGLGLAGEDLQHAADAVVKFGQVTREDTTAVASAITRVMQSWGAKDVAATLAMLQPAARLTQGGLTALAGQLTSAGPALRAAGFTLQDSAQLLASLAKHGVPAEDAIAGLGIALRHIAESGAPNIRQALERHVAAIRSAGSEAQQAAAAGELFGKKGTLWAEAIRSGAFTFGGGLATTEMAIEPVQRLGISFGKLRAAAEQALAPIGGAISSALTSLLGRVTQGVMLVGGLVSAFGAAPEWAQQGVLAIAGVALLVGPTLALTGGLIAQVGRLAAVGIKAIGIGPALIATAIAGLVAAGIGLATSARSLGTATTAAADAVSAGGAAIQAGGAVIQARAGVPPPVALPELAVALPPLTLPQIAAPAEHPMPRLPDLAKTIDAPDFSLPDISQPDAYKPPLPEMVSMGPMIQNAMLDQMRENSRLTMEHLAMFGGGAYGTGSFFGSNWGQHISIFGGGGAASAGMSGPFYTSTVSSNRQAAQFQLEAGGAGMSGPFWHPTIGPELTPPPRPVTVHLPSSGAPAVNLFSDQDIVMAVLRGLRAAKDLDPNQLRRLIDNLDEFTPERAAVAPEHWDRWMPPNVRAKALVLSELTEVGGRLTPDERAKVEAFAAEADTKAGSMPGAAAGGGAGAFTPWTPWAGGGASGGSGGANVGRSPGAAPLGSGATWSDQWVDKPGGVLTEAMGGPRLSVTDILRLQGFDASGGSGGA